MKKKIFVFVDESSIKEKPSDEVFCAIVIEEEYLDGYRNKIEQLRYDILDDPIYSEPYCGKKNQESLKKSFHMTENSFETRERFIELIRYFSFEVLIYIYDDSLEEEKKRCDYVEKLYKRLNQRYKDCKVNIIWEKDNKKIKLPSDIPIEMIEKGNDSLLEIADYVAWIFCRKYYGDIIKKQEFEKNRDEKYYAIFEDKIRFIKDYNIIKPFTSKNPLP